MIAQDITDPATRAHVKEMALLIHQCAVKHGMSVDEVIAWLLAAMKQEESS